MPHWLIHEAAIAGRVLAGLVGCVCFYLAFFLYEDEQGVWQNRLEQLWSTVYDRSKVIDSTSTALFNKIGQIVFNWSTRIFGRKLISIRSILTSCNLSTAYLLWGLDIDWSADFRHNLSIRTLHDHLMGLAIMLAFFVGTIAFAIVPIVFRRPPLLLLSLIIPIFVEWTKLTAYDWGRERNLEAVGMVVALLCSLISDVCAIVLVRRLFKLLANSLSLVTIILTMSILTIFSWLIYSLPSDIGMTFRRIDWIRNNLYELSKYNVPTAFFCLIPATLLVVLLTHRLIWPLLSRLLYPVASRRLITNNKVLIAAGTLALLFAFNLEHVGAKEFLKLLAS